VYLEPEGQHKEGEEKCEKTKSSEEK